MIEHLLIRNLILIEKAEIAFGKGLNIITGETGAGKSAILSAIRLILGERADIDLLRKGTDLAVVEALVDGRMIRREIHRAKPSRCFIDDELVSLQELREQLSSIELIDQSAAHKLSEQQILYLDSFCQRESAERFAVQFKALKEAEIRVAQLMQRKQSMPLESLEKDLALLEEVNWQCGEEERLVAEHHLLTNAQGLLEKISLLTALLAELSPLKRLTFSLESFSPLRECVEWLKTASANLDEANRFLLSYADRLEADPNRLFAVEKRLGQIESLKRNFGSYETVETLRASLKRKIEEFSDLDLTLDKANASLEEIRKETFAQAAALTQQRKEAAVRFSEAVIKELFDLNLPGVRFVVDMTPKPLSSNGADDIRFLFAANPGSPLLPIHQCASGGEISRLLLAIKITLADKEKSSCLIFDEIDSNVGGKTAFILGAKLQAMAADRQLIAVTHFVQVARFANDHFLVAKTTTPLGAETTISKLDSQTKEFEYARMTGSLI
ncbi:MAG TPA: AAA family ATPase [Chlamydiales bacterium]|jgi:DNA repair protein RecN (Recombination protein N)|nr:AAA family ATPase [Chlamydiales bacterium]